MQMGGFGSVLLKIAVSIFVSDWSVVFLCYTFSDMWTVLANGVTQEVDAPFLCFGRV
jgi:hypothetical protein